MEKPVILWQALLYSILLPILANGLFEYICDEKQLFRPYVHVYKQRRGPRLFDLGPGFYQMSEFKNVYICINGIAYLYFAKTTTISEVYEAPRLKKYAHTCEMYNVQPRKGSATVLEVTLHLKAILLLGDPNDYRLPSIQKFTAPYFFRKDLLNPHLPTDPSYVMQPPLYVNASSLIIIGPSECTLTKGDSSNEEEHALIKVRPHLFQATEDGSVEEEAYFCKIGFLPILQRASTPQGGPVPSEKERAPAFALMNDEALRVKGCLPIDRFDEAKASEKYSGIVEMLDVLENEHEKRKQTVLDDFKSQVDAELEKIEREKVHLVERKNAYRGKAKDQKKLDRQLAKLAIRKQVETDKKVVFERICERISVELDLSKGLRAEANPTGEKASQAKADEQSAEEAFKQWDTLKNQQLTAPETELKVKKVEYERAHKKARDSARKYQNSVSELELLALRVKKAVDKVKRLSIYVPSRERGEEKKRKSTTVNLNPDGASSLIISAKKEDCEKLPVLDGHDGECKKGKPEKQYVCNLFSTTLGIRNTWKNHTSVEHDSTDTSSSNSSETPSRNDDNDLRSDFWKKEVLQLVGDIFSTACDRIRGVKRMTNLISRIMGFYLTNDLLFNAKPDPQTDTCINYRYPTEVDTTSKGTPIINDLKEEKQFWSTIKLVLKQCRLEGRRLAFTENSTKPGYFTFIKDYATEKAHPVDVRILEEQADMEYAYNWPIDASWKMFVTVLGICITDYEDKIPLIASRFFSMYTEDFLIPLRETWVTPKDNIIFQFILSEFYNSQTDYWMDMCMESSFIYANQQDYRPPRTLMVNCHSENNYFVGKKDAPSFPGS